MEQRQCAPDMRISQTRQPPAPLSGEVRDILADGFDEQQFGELGDDRCRADAPRAISLTAKRNELSIQAPEAVARTSSFNKDGSDESNGLNGVSEPRNPHNNCVASPPPPYLIREIPPISGGWITSRADMGAMLRSLPKV
jgi:hypothetical protein